MDEQANIFVNQPLHIEIETDVDLTSATAVEIKFNKPDGTTDKWTAATIDAFGGIIKYDVPQNILNVAGIWKMWAYITYSNGSYPGEVFEIEIFKEGDVI